MRKRVSRSVSRGRRRRRSQSGAGSFSSVSSRLYSCSLMSFLND